MALGVIFATRGRTHSRVSSPRSLTSSRCDKNETHAKTQMCLFDARVSLCHCPFRHCGVADKTRCVEVSQKCCRSAHEFLCCCVRMKSDIKVRRSVCYLFILWLYLYHFFLSWKTQFLYEVFSPFVEKSFFHFSVSQAIKILELFQQPARRKQIAICFLHLYLFSACNHNHNQVSALAASLRELKCTLSVQYSII